ncbi:FtsB family cell division protein [Streptococcus orisasini]
MEKPNIVQLNNKYINDENTRKRYEEEEARRRHRFIGWILVFIILLFILPAYNLVASYMNLQQKKEQIVKLQKQQEQLNAKTEAEQKFAKRLKDDSYVEKYARAKYYYSIDGENIYPAPSLLPK